MRRQVSQQLPSQRPQSEVASRDRQEKNKLKHLLGRVNLLANGGLELEEGEQIGTVHRFMQSLGK